MSQHLCGTFVLEDAFFSKLSDLYLKFDTIFEFINNYIQNHPNKALLLRNLSDLYVLVATKISHPYLRKGEKSWDDLLTNEMQVHFNKSGEYILGYILLGEKVDNEYQIIEFIDTRLKGYNLAEYMMNKYRKKNKFDLIPGEIIQSSVEYWKKYFCIDTKEDAYELMKGIKYDFKWDNLIDSFDEDEDKDDEDKDDEDNELIIESSQVIKVNE